MKELVVEAKTENLDKVLAFVDQELKSLGCSSKTQMQIEIAVEEVFVNVAHYAYLRNGKKEKGMAKIGVANSKDPYSAMVTITDDGIPFNPLAKEDPDITLSSEQRKIGGLGIYMVKRSMDAVHYAYENGKNILTIRKDL